MDGVGVGSVWGICKEMIRTNPSIECVVRVLTIDSVAGPLYDLYVRCMTIGCSVRTRPQCRLPLGVNLQSISRVRWPHSSYIRGGDIKDFTCLPVPTVVNKTHVFRSEYLYKDIGVWMIWYGMDGAVLCIIYRRLNKPSV